ncbi:hypothetical protein HYALB_00000545 [Hymenoscyphus albidus]|uniref:Uncharacterized protein n=1 Tax=Hymenoscyphus albidus TaxID=595503 RepID=A0A9N9LYI4_9HELO|nr:hypothetical protein HYALB_00000545 [Hymenoscyphus albidus]
MAPERRCAGNSNRNDNTNPDRNQTKPNQTKIMIVQASLSATPVPVLSRLSPSKIPPPKKPSKGYPKNARALSRSHAPKKRSKRTTDQKALNSDRILTKHCQTTDVKTQTWTEEANGSVA